MDARKRRTLTHRAVLAVVLWLGFWALGLALTAALLWVPVAQSRYEGGVDTSGWLAGLGAAAVAWALRPRHWFSEKKADELEPLDQEGFPALHELLAEAASRSGGTAPDEVHLLAQSTAFIRVDRKGLFQRRQVIGLGLPLFAFLSRTQLASVLMHEFGHRHGGDLLLGPWVRRTGSALASVIDSLDGSAFFLDAPFRMYGGLFLRVSGDVSREQELAADAHAAAVYGTDATWEALEKVHRLGRCWDVYFALDAAPLIELGCRPPLLEGFRRFLAQPLLRAEVAEALEASARAKPAPGDTHPPAVDRLAALAPRRIPPDGRATSDLEADCLDLLGGEQAAEQAWYVRATRGELVSLGWDEVGPKVLLPKLLESFAATSINPRTTALSTLPEHVRDAEQFWNRMRPSALSLLSPAGMQRRGRQLLGDWLAAALFTRGFSPEVRPGAHLRLARADATIVPAELVAELARGALSADAYRNACAAWERSP